MYRRPIAVALTLGIAMLFTMAGAAVASQTAEPFRATPEIRDAAREASSGKLTRARKVHAIIEAIFDDRGGFQYSRRQTLPASEAFEQRSGNCLSLVNLFVAMARSVGVPAVFVEVTDFESYHRTGGQVFLSTHIVGGVWDGRSLETVDFLPGSPKTYRSFDVVSDRRATAHFYNAIGVEALIRKDHGTAREYLERALASDPDFLPAWNNLGVLERRSGHPEAAVMAYESALSRDAEYIPSIESLGNLQDAMGNGEEAERLRLLAFELKTRNPFYLVSRALDLLESEKPEEAYDLLRRAHRLGPELPEVYLLLGRVALALNRPGEAHSSFAQARRLSEPSSLHFQRQVEDKISLLLER